MSTYRVLVVDDIPSHCLEIKAMIDDGVRAQKLRLGLFEQDRVITDTMTSTEEVLQMLPLGKDFGYDIILADIFMPFGDLDACVEGGAKRIYEAIKQHELQEQVLLILMTNRNSEASFLLNEIYKEQLQLERPWVLKCLKPTTLRSRYESDEELFDPDIFTYAVCRAIAKHRDNEWRRTFVKSTLFTMHGRSPAITQVLFQAEEYANEKVILLLGEEGTGKEKIAETIHNNSIRARKGGRFVMLDFKTLAPSRAAVEIFGHEAGWNGINSDKASLFQRARAGTVFVDRFDTNPSALQEIELQLRLLLGANSYIRMNGVTPRDFRGTMIFGISNTADRIQDNLAYEALYPEIAGYQITVPPLRERVEDINILAQMILGEQSGETVPQLTSSAADLLARYEWPHNLPQLEKVIGKLGKLPRTRITDEDVRKELSIWNRQIAADISETCRAQSTRIRPKHIGMSTRQRSIECDDDRLTPRIGIITALEKEFAPVRAMLENPRECHVSGRGAGRRYVVGDVPSDHSGSHSVVLTLGDVGNNIASARASLLLEHFPNVESIMMIGIAGGVPYPKVADDHVRLGDVVVANHKGVVQYDFDKETIVEIENRSPPRPPSARLIEAVRLLKVSELLNQRPWLPHISKLMHMLNVARPSEEADVLVRSTQPMRKIEHPRDPKRVAGQPRIFIGPIASANKVLKNPVKRDTLRNTFGVKAVEMEGSGIADATWNHEVGYLVVRGICDYCDGNKNDTWQDYAAIVAAAYTRALLESIPDLP